MNSLFKYPIVSLVLMLVFSCNNSEKKSSNINKNEKAIEKTDVFSMDTSGIAISWIAYKFTNKTGVKGVFDEYVLSTENKSGPIEALLENSKIDIITSSVNSGDAIRDPKLRAIFFKVLNTDTIKGQIKEVKSGTGILTLEMNNILNDIPYNYYLTQDTIIFSTTIDVTKWKGQEAIQALNKECYELHTGTDGISKLWPDVDVSIRLPLNRILKKN